MMKLLRRRGRTRNGSPLAGAYTLTEMLVVLVIIGLLAAVVGPRLFNRLDDAKQRTARLQLASLDTAIDLFRLDVGRLPTSEEGLEALVIAPTDGAEAWLGPYLAREQLPRDPWGQAYLFEIDAATGGYRLISYGADTREGGAGAAADVILEGGGDTPRSSNALDVDGSAPVEAVSP
jgi:general secretion pathway protein G